jgi:hypothetical protein
MIPQKHATAIILLLPMIALVILWRVETRSGAPLGSFTANGGDPIPPASGVEAKEKRNRREPPRYSYAISDGAPGNVYHPIPTAAFRPDFALRLSRLQPSDSRVGYQSGPTRYPAVFALIDLGASPIALGKIAATVQSHDIDSLGNASPVISYAWSDNGGAFTHVATSLARPPSRRQDQVVTYSWNASRTTAHRYWQVYASLATTRGSSSNFLKLLAFRLYGIDGKVIGQSSPSIPDHAAR